MGDDIFNKKDSIGLFFCFHFINLAKLPSITSHIWTIILHYFFLLIHYLYIVIFHYFKPSQYYKQEGLETKAPYIPFTHPNKKPSWVKEKVLYLKVHLPHDGCRKVAIHFNKIYVDKDISVSKSYVYRVLKDNGYEVLQMRKEIRSKLPYKKNKNQLWHMDLTTINKMQIFGVVDSGTRALVALKHLQSKSTIKIIRTLLDAIELYGKPKAIKSDNEIVFTSKLMKFTLWVLGIKRETTQIASPWQNGKIERLFGTMKQSFIELVFPSTQSLENGLKEFRFFYNHIRLHQNLGYNTPANAWDNKLMSRRKNCTYITCYRGLCDNVAGFYYRE